jgi:hypothetical protein
MPGPKRHRQLADQTQIEIFGQVERVVHLDEVNHDDHDDQQRRQL